jgi:hypothetical protein
MPSCACQTRDRSHRCHAQYGTGYCDSQCPHDLKVRFVSRHAFLLELTPPWQFIGGQANNVGWNGTTANSGKGTYGSCCSEMDIWEANQYASAYTPHPCSVRSFRANVWTSTHKVTFRPSASRPARARSATLVVSATRPAATSTRGAWATRPSSGRA